MLKQLFAGQTLQELRACLAQAEAEVTGGLSPRILPMAEIRDLGGLLQRAGFALPVADSFSTQVRYRDAFHLMHDLRAMGEGNAMAARLRKPNAPPEPEAEEALAKVRLNGQPFEELYKAAVADMEAMRAALG